MGSGMKVSGNIKKSLNSSHLNEQRRGWDLARPLVPRGAQLPAADLALQI